MTSTVARPAVTREIAVEVPLRPLAGLRIMVRLVLRRDRVRIALWFAATVGLVAASAASITGLYDTQAELDQYGQLVRDNAALIVQAGPGYGLATPTTGSVLMNETEIWTVIAVALMSVFMMVRHTRTEEESERAELVRAAPVGRHTTMLAAFIGVGVANVAIAFGVAVVLLAYGLPFIGSVAFGVTLVAAGLLHAGVAAVAAQISGSARTSIALGAAVIAVAFVLRAVGDVRGNIMSWLSPLGWAQAIRAYAGERWWVVALPIGATVLLAVVAVELQARRDFGAGLLQQRPGRAEAAPALRSPLALAVRLQRGWVTGWTVGLALIGFFYGIVADQAESIIEDNPDMADFFAQLGQASITDAFLATSALMLALIASGFTVASVLRLRTEETAVRADPILATPVPRARWIRSHLLVAGLGSVLLMAATGAAVGAGFALMTGDAGQIPRLAAAQLVMVPAMFVVGAAAFAVCAIAPRWAIASWTVVAAVIVIGLFAAVLKMPQWLVDVSPFAHVPALPAADFHLLPLFALTLVAAAVAAVGLAAYERREHRLTLRFGGPSGPIDLDV